MPPIPLAAARGLAALAWAVLAAFAAAAEPPDATAPAAATTVGRSELAVDGLRVVLSYPTAAAPRDLAFGPFSVRVAMGAEPAAGRRRLVVVSHGTGGSDLPDHDLAAALVRAGFVVAQPLHRGDHAGDTRDAGPVAFERRPREVSAVIDALAADPQWAPRLQLDRVGVHGMSAGGVAGLALAGARWRMKSLIDHCLAHGEADAGFCLQGTVTPAQQAERRARFESARGVPDDALPPALLAWHGGLAGAAEPAVDPHPDPRPDPRIAAVTLAVPVAAIFSAESLARIAIPVGVVAAERDQVLLPRFHSGHVLAHCRSCVALATLPGAGHFDVLAPWPPAVAERVAAGQLRGGAPEPGFDPAERAAAQARVARFLREQLR
jgi:predicted dienelactone hydrolase